MINKIKMMFLVNICLIMTYPELFSQPDESKRVKRCLSSLSKVFLGLDKSKTNKLTLKPTLGCFHGLDERQRMLVLSRVVFTTG
jgi:hypothetical protein